MSQTPPRNPNFPPQGPLQYPQQPQGYPQQGFTQNPQHGYPQQPPPMMPLSQPPKKKSWYKRPWGIVLILFLALGICGGISNAISAASGKSATTTATQTQSATLAPTDTPAPTPQPIHYPPTTENDLRGLAAQGDANAIHEFHSESVGAVGACPEPKRLVTVDPSITGQQLAEDLLAYFYTQQIDSPCGSLVLAYHKQADLNDPNTGGVYTAGRINFDVLDASGANNVDPNATNLTHKLTLDVGDLTTGKEYAVTY